MLRCEILDVQGFDPAIHGMRNPKNSWDKSDSYDAVDCGKCGLIEEKGVCNKEDRQIEHAEKIINTPAPFFQTFFHS